jgi:hypothetical protein
MAKYDAGSAVSGAAAGAKVGSVGGPWGSLAGGVIGGALGLLSSKKKKKRKPKSTLDKRQQQLNEAQHDSIFSKGPLADLYNYDPEAANDVFDKTRVNKAYRDLNERAIPSVTGQFRNQGLMRSSYAGDAIGRLTRDVQENLDAERSKYLYAEQSDARNAKRNAVENLQNRNTQAQDLRPRSKSTMDQLMSSFTPENIESVKNLFSNLGA